VGGAEGFEGGSSDSDTESTEPDHPPPFLMEGGEARAASIRELLRALARERQRRSGSDPDRMLEVAPHTSLFATDRV